MALKNYEIVMVFSLANGEEAVEVLKQKFTDLIAKHGTLGNVEEWGKRKLAYPINYENDGYYIVIDFTSDEAFPQELDRVINITDGVLRSVVLMGRLTYEPELKTTTSGLSVIRFQMAVDRNYQSQGQERQADFIDVVAWRQTAEFISRYFHKGSMIAVEGSIQTNNFTDRDGNKRKSVEVVANQVSFCGSKAETQGANPAFSQPAPSYSTADNSDFEEIVDDDDDLPF